jgi:hypothetical protein
MKTLTFKLIGTNPFLMHAGKNIDNTPKDFKDWPDSEKAEAVAYRNPSTRELVLPASNFMRGLVSAGKYVKPSNSPKTRVLTPLLTAAVTPAKAEFSFGTTEYAIDKQSVVVQHQRIPRVRPSLDNWQIAGVALHYDESMIVVNDLKEAIVKLGALIGLGDFRPEKKGFFGTFKVEF